MKQLLIKAGQRLAPRTLTNLKTLSTMDKEFDQGPARFLAYEREIAALRRDIDELRRDNRRVAELYDVVFDWAKANAAVAGTVPPVDGRRQTLERVADVIAGDK
jgi:hypothetical protein